MNKVVLMGRLTKDPDVRYTEGSESKAIARYTLAVDRKTKDANGNRQADFISCVAFGKSGEFAEKYLHKGLKICISGRIQTGNYTNKDGNKVYTTDVVVEEQDFCESKSADNTTQTTAGTQSTMDSFTQIPDGIDEVLPFN
jgi:single-strand DNA-binding protein